MNLLELATAIVACESEPAMSVSTKLGCFVLSEKTKSLVGARRTSKNGNLGGVHLHPRN